MVDLVFHPNDKKRIGDFLVTNLQSKDWALFRCAVAFAKNSGVKHLYRPLMDFTQRRNSQAILTIGIDARGTSYDALMNLRDALKNNAELWIYHNRSQVITFHPKVFLFANNRYAKVAIGSGNLTEGGLFSNYEAFAILDLDLSVEQDAENYQTLVNELNNWKDENGGCAIAVTEGVLENLRDADKIPTESILRRERVSAERISRQGNRENNILDQYFQRTTTQRAPRQASFPIVQPVPSDSSEEIEAVRNQEVDEQEGLYEVFYMTLKKTDVGVGQTTAGTSRRSPEIFIPLSARNADPVFWGWRALFTEDTNREGKYDRHQVPVRINGSIELVNMMTWPVKSDFRLRNEALRSNANIDDILRIRRADGQQGFQYDVTIIAQGTDEYLEALANCINTTRNSEKLWGYR